jgi:uncharacterized protein YbjQ (UPF0145 family)
MKKTLILFAITFLLGGCSVIKTYKEDVSIISYSDYKGFFISESNSVSFEYEPIGSVVASVSSGYDDTEYITASPGDLLYIMCDEAKKKKANGIINLKISYEFEYNQYTNQYSIKSVNGTGMAIKR